MEPLLSSPVVGAALTAIGFAVTGVGAANLFKFVLALLPPRTAPETREALLRADLLKLADGQRADIARITIQVETIAKERDDYRQHWFDCQEDAAKERKDREAFEQELQRLRQQMHRPTVTQERIAEAEAETPTD